MSILQSAVKGPQMRPPKGILYGPPGVGKTTFAASANGAFLLDCENGCANLDCERSPYLSSWPEMEKWLDALANEKHDYSVVAIDTIDWMITRMAENIAGVTDRRLNATLNSSHGGYGNGGQVLKNYIYRALLPRLEKIVANGSAVVLLAHQDKQTTIGADGITAERIGPDLGKKMLTPFVEWADFVFYARVMGDVREIVPDEQPGIVAKNRYGIKQKFPLDWSAFCDLLN